MPAENEPFASSDVLPSTSARLPDVAALREPELFELGYLGALYSLGCRTSLGAGLDCRTAMATRVEAALSHPEKGVRALALAKALLPLKAEWVARRCT